MTLGHFDVVPHVHIVTFTHVHVDVVTFGHNVTEDALRHKVCIDIAWDDVEDEAGTGIVGIRLLDDVDGQYLDVLTLLYKIKG